jgi:hypothetical protein
LAVHGDERKKQQKEACNGRMAEGAEPTSAGFKGDDTRHDDEPGNAGRSEEKQLL